MVCYSTDAMKYTKTESAFFVGALLFLAVFVSVLIYRMVRDSQPDTTFTYDGSHIEDGIEVHSYTVQAKPIK